MRKFSSIAIGSTFQRDDDRIVYTKTAEDTYQARGGRPKDAKGKMEVHPVIERRTMVISLGKSILKSKKLFIPQGTQGRTKNIDGEHLTIVFDEVFVVDGDMPGEVVIDHEVTGISARDVFLNNIEVVVERVGDDSE